MTDHNHQLARLMFHESDGASLRVDIIRDPFSYLAVPNHADLADPSRERHHQSRSDIDRAVREMNSEQRAALRALIQPVWQVKLRRVRLHGQTRQQVIDIVVNRIEALWR